MLTLNPATLLGIEFKKGSLRVGADADILLLDEGLHVTNVWARGVCVKLAGEISALNFRDSAECGVPRRVAPHQTGLQAK